MVLIPNKFHCTHRHELKPAETLTIGLVARFRPQKRVDRWAEVAAEAQKKNPNIKFLMVGDGPSDDLLRQRIKELNIEGVIELPGMLTDTYAAYKRIDIFLLTSDFEGLPLGIA
jgi:glycosyltransferase involved in cell wall biosynthesis